MQTSLTLQCLRFEYLGYWITRYGIQPVPKKVEAIQCIAPLTTRKQVQSFIGLINYYRDMWPRHDRNYTAMHTHVRWSVHLSALLIT
jgi:hypothetical protein